METDRGKIVASVVAPFHGNEQTMKLEMNVIDKVNHPLRSFFEGLNAKRINPGDYLKLSGTFRFSVMVISGKLVGTPTFIVNQTPVVVDEFDSGEYEKFTPRDDVPRYSFKDKEAEHTLAKVREKMEGICTVMLL